MKAVNVMLPDLPYPFKQTTLPQVPSLILYALLVVAVHHTAFVRKWCDALPRLSNLLRCHAANLGDDRIDAVAFAEVTCYDKIRQPDITANFFFSGEVVKWRW